MIVVDASALVEALTLSDLGFQVMDRLEEHAGALHAPGLIDVEVSHTLRRLVHRGDVDSASAYRAIGDLKDFPLNRWDHRDLLAGAWALREHVSTYDAMYVALAETLNAPLLTVDVRLFRNISNHETVDLIRLD